MFKKTLNTRLQAALPWGLGLCPSAACMNEEQNLKDGSLAVRDRVYSIPHIAILFLRKIKGKAYEYEVVLVVLLLQVIIAMYTLYSFFGS